MGFGSRLETSIREGEGRFVRIDNTDADGFVVIDAVQWLLVKAKE